MRPQRQREPWNLIKRLILQAILVHLSAPLWAGAQPATQPARGAYLLHLPGIGGPLPIDSFMLAGLSQGGVKGRLRVYDWTEHDPGVDALHAYDRNQRQAQRVADLLAAQAAQEPGEPIVLMSHSGGGAMAVWALEKLPANVLVQDCFLLAPALSPGYDLSRALRHVRGKMYVFWSSGDELILGFGCRMCGTMDGVHTAAAGRVGFSVPASADEREYRKLKQRPYDPAWFWLGNWGDHIGPMSGPFAAKVLAPLILNDIK